MSVTANSIVAIAVPCLVLERTGSAALAELAGAAAIAPIDFSAVFGGALIDRIGKKRCSMIADTLQRVGRRGDPGRGPVDRAGHPVAAPTGSARPSGSD